MFIEEDEWHMMLRTLLMLVILFMAVQGRCTDGPAIACRTPVYNFSESDDSQSVTNTFALWNDGNAPLEIGKIRGCCGATTELAGKTVPPGTNTTLKVTLSLKGRQGEQQKSFYVGSNDPRQPYCQLRFVGKVSARVSIEPPAVDFGRVRRDAETQSEVTVTAMTNCGFRVTNVLMSAGSFSATNQETTSDGRSHRVTIKTVPPLPPGVTQGQVTLLTDNDRCGRVDISVVVAVSNDMVVIPAQIALPSAGDKPEPVTRYVAVRSRSGVRFNILKVTTPDPDIRAKWEPFEGSGYRCVLSNILPSANLEGGNVVISTDHSDVGDILVPIRLLPPEPSARSPVRSAVK